MRDRPGAALGLACVAQDALASDDFTWSLVSCARGRRQHRDQPSTKFKRATLIAVPLEQSDRTVVGPCGDGSTSLWRVAQVGDFAADNLKMVDLLDCADAEEVSQRSSSDRPAARCPSKPSPVGCPA
jgi:hypothetical protein